MQNTATISDMVGVHGVLERAMKAAFKRNFGAVGVKIKLKGRNKKKTDNTVAT